MPSVVVSWNGSSPNRSEREHLIAALEPFAAASAALFPEPSPILRFDGPVEGTALVLLSRKLQETLRASVEDRESTAEALRKCGGALVPLQGEADYDGEVRTRWLLRLPNANLHGLQWRVYDPRDLYGGEDLAGFVSLVLPEAPLLDGLLFEVQTDLHYTLFDDPSLGPAEWRLAQPGIHLRYYLESWFDRFLAWVRFFHVPSLRTNGYQEDSGWPCFDRSARFRLRYEGLSRSELESRLAGELLEDFRQEAGSWNLFCGAGPDRPVYEIEFEAAQENARLAALASSDGSDDRPSTLQALADGLLERARLLETWPGRATEYQACLAEADGCLAELRTLRSSEDDLVALARQRLEAATHDFPTEDDLVENEDALVGSDAAPADSPSPLQEGFAALLAVSVARRPVLLEARYRLLLADGHLHAEALAAALEEADRACSLFEATDPARLETADFARATTAHVVAALALERLGRLEEAVDRLLSGVKRSRERRAGRADDAGEEAFALVHAAELQTTLGQTDGARRSYVLAEATYRVLSQGADRYASRWTASRMEMLRRLSLLESDEGNPEGALKHLAALLAFAGQTDGWATLVLRRIAEIELERSHYFEAADAAVTGLAVIDPFIEEPSEDAAVLEEILREARRCDPRLLADLVVPGTPS